LRRQCATRAAFPVYYADASDPTDTKGICELVSRDTLDFLFVDVRLARDDRKAIYQAALSATGRPLVILIGAAALMSSEVALQDATADGLLRKPIDPAEAGAMINSCARTRLPKQVLVVDDSATVRAVVRKVLQASRFRLELSEAGDGQSALEKAARGGVDVMLLDCNMPDLDGFATMERLSCLGRDLQVVMTTSTKDPRLQQRAQGAGANDFLFQPFYTQDVDAVLRRLFGLVPTAAK